MNPIGAAAGGLLFQGGSALLVKVGYGANRGMWMIPGGLVEPGESIEEAASREFREETGLTASTDRIVCLRSGTQEKNGAAHASLYVVFEMKFLSGTLRQDETEIEDVRFWTVEEVIRSNEVIELSRNIIVGSWDNRNGLVEGRRIHTQHAYRSYRYYISNDAARETTPERG